MSIAAFYPHNDNVNNKIASAYREGVDPIFHEIAKKAAWCGRHGNYTGYEGVNFLHPTSHVRGYYSVLKFIAENPGKSRDEIFKHYHTAISVTLDRLLDGGLIENVNHKFLPTENGKIYLMSAKDCLCKRAEVAVRNYKAY